MYTNVLLCIYGKKKDASEKFLLLMRKILIAERCLWLNNEKLHEG